MSRFIQLFLLAAMVLLLPSLFYLSRQQQPYSMQRDFALMQTQTTQGSGPPPAIDPQIAQSWKWSKPWDTWDLPASGVAAIKAKLPFGSKVDKVEDVTTKAIMPKMENATAKAELGRATWKFLHTMTLRFPDKPSKSEREVLLRFFTDFSQLYPCGECAEHFQKLLIELPPQTSSRMASALWLCAAHNKVNERLGKPEFPCDKLDETYDCGCGDKKDKNVTGQDPNPPLPATAVGTEPPTITVDPKPLT